MRLICGLLRLDGAPADPATLQAMAAAMTPPGLTPLRNSRADKALAMAVLDFAAVSAERPSAELETGTHPWIAADLRLDNGADLALALGLSPRSSPERLVAGAVTRWGEALPAKVDGDFALAAWDPVEEALLLARDAMGARPLCYAFAPGKVFAFASLPSGVLAAGLVPVRPDLGALAERMHRPLIECTGLRDVHWLPAASTLMVSRAGPGVPRRAWTPRLDEVGAWRGDAREARAELLHLTRRAVTARLPAHGPVGVQLSGGLDSSALAILATRHAPSDRAVIGYSYLADPAWGVAVDDETPFIQAVLEAAPGLRSSVHHLGRLDALAVVGDVDRLTATLVEPSMAALLATARADGVTALMHGLGGDETASQQHPRTHLHALAHGRVLAVTRDIFARARRVGTSPMRMAYRLLVAPWLARPVRRDWLRAADMLSTEARAAARPFPDRGLDARASDRLRRVISGSMANRVNDHAIAGAKHGLAMTFPLLDRRLVAFSLSLPSHLLFDAGHLRQPFRAAMAGVLPERVRLRDSKYMALPDLAARLAEAWPGLLALRARLEGEPAAEALLDFSRVDEALNRAAPDPRAVDPKDMSLTQLARVLAVAHTLVALSPADRDHTPGARQV